jgi:type II secretory pathway component PulF
MRTWTLDDLTACHAELAALAAAGVPLGRPWDGPPKALKSLLDAAFRSLALAMARGASLDEALADPATDLPPTYRGAMQTMLRSRSLPSVAAGASRRGRAESEFRRIARRAWTYPLIVLALAVCGVWLLGRTYAPQVAAMYEQLRLPTGEALQLLERVARWLPAWAPLAAGLGGGALWRSGALGGRAWLPGAGRPLAALDQANFAHQLALLCAQGVALDDAAPIAADAVGDPRLAAACAEARGGSAGAGQSPARRTAELRPLLRWALSHELPAEQRVASLRLASHLALEASRRQLRWQGMAWPAVTGAAIGGLAVFLYGLLLFVPWVELLRTLAQ